jgi:hypothetical protein
MMPLLNGALGGLVFDLQRFRAYGARAIRRLEQSRQKDTPNVPPEMPDNQQRVACYALVARHLDQPLAAMIRNLFYEID